MDKFTKKHAQDLINEYKDMTNYFSGILSAREMYEMFRYRYSFGEAEAAVIVAALVNSGAKFKGTI